MQYTVVRHASSRAAAVLVERTQLRDNDLITRLQRLLGMPVMLVARDTAAVEGVRAYAEFDTAPLLFALLSRENIDWVETPGG